MWEEITLKLTYDADRREVEALAVARARSPTPSAFSTPASSRTCTRGSTSRAKRSSRRSTV